MSLSRPSGLPSRRRADRLRDLGWVAFVQSGAILGLASAALATLPFRRALAFGQAPLGHAKNGSIDDIVWAVGAWSAKLPLRTKCIEQGIAVQRLLRRRGHDARLHYGARQSATTGRLEAHVWVTVDGRAVIGEERKDDFAEVASYP